MTIADVVKRKLNRNLWMKEELMRQPMASSSR